MPHASSAVSSPEPFLRPPMPELCSPTTTTAQAVLRNLTPGLREVLLLTLLTGLLFVATTLSVKDYRSVVDNFGDNSAYISAASAIRHWDFTAIHVKQFWGYPYAMALLSALTHIPERDSLLLVSCASSFLGIGLAYRLWGGWIAAFFAVLNFDWMQRSFLGGAEPLAVALIFGAFLAFRRDRYLLAALLASLSTVVRPLGIFCLLGIGVVLLYRREFKKLGLTVLVGALVGALYILPFWVYFHDPLYQVHRYKTSDWHSGSAVGFPFAAIGSSIVHNQDPWTNLLLTVGWVMFVLAGTAMMVQKDFRAYAREHMAEAGFAFLYIAFLFTYNSSHWARAEFIRFAVPVLPFVLLSLNRWTPKSRIIVYSLATMSSVFAACSAIGLRNMLRAIGL
jgi:hypothetical protein